MKSSLDRDMKVVATISMLVFFVLPASACRLPKTDPWFWSKSELVKRTDSILLAKAIEISPPKKAQGDRRGWNYTFDVLEVLKGKRTTRALIENFEAPSSGADFKGKMRSLYNSACEVAVGFEVGKTYLLFLKSFHPLGYEEIRDSDDPWLAEVRKYLEKKR
ncbi:MAG: hypothetical protein KF799_10110 [Bdellovibrionales bacterium]|nr:hypothetical protein [Bdellovibrionales bacterium]